MKKALLFIPVLFCFLNSRADYTVNGYVTDRKTGEALIGVSIYSFDKKIGGITNNYGFYSITFESKRDSVDLFFSYLGYRTEAFKLKLSKELTLNVSLEVDNDLEEVEVVAERRNETLDNPQVSKIELSGARIKKIPAILGEPDVIKVIQLQPGVQKGSEAGTGLYVRGGSNDQNLILLDGAPLYNVSHSFNFFSVFNPDAVNYVTFYKGGFPARFGERLSSVLDITMKEGNNKKISGSFSLGTVSARMMLEGPLTKSGNTTFMLSARRTYLDVLTKPLINAFNSATSGLSGDFGYYFYDINFKLSHRFSQNDRVYFSFYNGLDELYISEKFNDNSNPGSSIESSVKAGLNWGNILGTVRWNHVFSKKLFANFMADFTRYRTNIFVNLEDIAITNGSQSALSIDFLIYNGIRDISGKADFEYTPNPDHKINFGGNIIRHYFTPGTINLKFFATGYQPLDTTLYSSRNIVSDELALYAEDQVSFGKKIKLDYGLRFSSLFVDSSQYFYLEPRASARYYVNKKWSMKLSYALVHQYIQRILISDLGLPLDYWAPSTKYIKPQASHQVVLASNHSLKHGIDITVEAYYKYMKNINALKYANDIFNISLSNWENNVEQGEAHSFGLEVLAMKKLDERWSGWIGYTLSKSIQRFPTVNGHEYFPTDFDRRHDLTLVAIWKKSKKWTYSFTTIITSGQPYTFPVGRYLDRNGVPRLEYAGRNNIRLPYTKRIDVAFSRNPVKKNGFTISYDLSFYNVGFAKNPSGASITYRANGTPSAVYTSILPFIVPALSINLQF